MNFVTSKQLSLAVSVALCGGITFAAAPQVVCAASATYAGFWFSDDGNYGTYNGGSKNSWGSTMAEVVSDVYADATADAPIVLNVVNSASSDGSDFETKTGKSFGELLGADSVTIPAGSGISISDGDGNSVALTAQTAMTISGATSTVAGTLVYDGVQVQAADGTLAKVEVKNVTASTAGTVRAAEIDVTGTGALTAAGATTLAADTLVLDSTAISSLNSNYVLTSASGGNLVIKESNGNALDDATFQSLLEHVSSTVTVTNNNTTDASGNIITYQGRNTSEIDRKKAAVRAAGRTALAPAAGASRTATMLDELTQANVLRRTEVLRNRPPKTVRPTDQKDLNLPSDNIWLEMNHSKVEIDDSDYVGKTTVNLNQYQLGYDTKLGTKDYFGAFLGTAGGRADFTSYDTSTPDGHVDIKHALDGGFYGMHKGGHGSYIDYLVHYGKFDNRYQDVRFGTHAISAMLLGGWTKELRHGTVNPYLALTARKISLGDYSWGGHAIQSDDQKQYAARIGVDYAYKGGAFGGIAYSRGLSGDLTAAYDGFALPALDYDTQVLYLKLGYRGKLSQRLNFDLLAQEYLLDYKGWSVNGKLELGF